MKQVSIDQWIATDLFQLCTGSIFSTDDQRDRWTQEFVIFVLSNLFENIGDEFQLGILFQFRLDDTLRVRFLRGNIAKDTTFRCLEEMDHHRHSPLASLYRQQAISSRKVQPAACWSFRGMNVLPSRAVELLVDEHRLNSIVERHAIVLSEIENEQSKRFDVVQELFGSDADLIPDRLQLQANQSIEGSQDRLISGENVLIDVARRGAEFLETSIDQFHQGDLDIHHQNGQGHL